MTKTRMLVLVILNTWLVGCVSRLNRSNHRSGENLGSGKSSAESPKDQGDLLILNGTPYNGDNIGIGALIKPKTHEADSAAAPFCTATEIAPRCILTAAHCLFPDDSPEESYTQMANGALFHKNVIAIENRWKHPLWNGSITRWSRMTREDSMHDLGIAWTNAFVNEGFLGGELRSSGKLAIWAPRSLSSEPLTVGQKVGVMGYGPTTEFGGSSSVLPGQRYRNSGTMKVQSVYHGDPGSGAALIKTSTGTQNVLMEGDSGGPVFRDYSGDVSAVYSAGNALRNPDGWDLVTTFVHPKNANFVSLSTNRSPEDMKDTAADYCRLRLFVRSSSLGSDGVPGVGQVIGRAEDPLRIHPDDTIDCGGDCNMMAYKKIVFDAVAIDPVYPTFEKWDSPPEEGGICPCEPANEPHCEIADINSLPRKYDWSGVSCRANFKSQVIESGYQ